MVILQVIPHIFDGLKRLGALLHSSPPSKEFTEPEVDKPECFIFAPGWRDYLPMIVAQMDITTFVRFSRMNKDFYDLAKKGIIKKPISVKCYTRKIYGDAHPYHFLLTCNKTVLGDDALENLIKMPWLVPELEELMIDCKDAPMEWEIHTLLDLIGVKRIMKVESYGNFDIDRFLEKYSVRTLELFEFDHPAMYRSSKLLEVPHLNFRCDLPWQHPQDIESMRILRNSTATRIGQFFHGLPPTFVVETIENWLEGKKNFESFCCAVADDIHYEESFQRIARMVITNSKYPISCVNMPYFDGCPWTSKVMDFVQQNIPRSIVVGDECFVILREDKKMLWVQDIEMDENRYHVFMEEH